MLRNPARARTIARQRIHYQGGPRLLAQKIILTVAIALTATSCVDPSMMSGQPGSANVGGASTPALDTFYQGGSYDRLQNKVVAQGGDKATRVTIRGTIAPNGPDSWMRSAPWNEVVLTVQNLSRREIDVVSIQGVTANGVLVQQGGMDAFTNIEKQRADTLQNQPTQPAQAAPGADVGSMAANAITGALGLGAYGANALAGAGANVTAQQQKARQDAQDAAVKQQAADFQSVSDEYTKRAIEQAKLAAKGSITGSAFFPTTAGEITGIVVSVRESPRSETAKDITLSIPRGSIPTETASGATKVP